MNRRDPVDDMKVLLPHKDLQQLYIILTMGVIYGISYFLFAILFYIFFPPVL